MRNTNRCLMCGKFIGSKTTFCLHCVEKLMPFIHLLGKVDTGDVLNNIGNASEALSVNRIVLMTNILRYAARNLSDYLNVNSDKKLLDGVCTACVIEDGVRFGMNQCKCTLDEDFDSAL